MKKLIIAFSIAFGFPIIFFFCLSLIVPKTVLWGGEYKYSPTKANVETQQLICLNGFEYAVLVIKTDEGDYVNTIPVYEDLSVFGVPPHAKICESIESTKNIPKELWEE